VTGSLYSIVCREGGAGGGDGRRGRTKGPRRRPPYTAHPAAWWPPEVTAQHLADVRLARDEQGEWKDWADLTESERWSWWWEELRGYENMGEVTEVEVP
jgi:hypothetical protein